MIQAGVLTDDDPVELLEGVLVFKMPKNPPHVFVVEAAAETINKILNDGWFYRQQEPITLEDGEPEPDGIVIRGSRTDYRSRHPSPADVALIIEVADKTLSRDRGIKLRSYARAGIAEYWIINLIDRCVEVYRHPETNQSEATYRDKVIHHENESVSMATENVLRESILVRSLLP